MSDTVTYERVHPTTDETLQEAVRALVDIRSAIAARGSDGHVFGFHIDSGEGDSTACVTYLADAVGMTPARMNFAGGAFQYGSWEDAFFLPRPCMLKPDGTVDYYLHEMDYTLREDGATPSHVAHLGWIETSATASKAYAVDDYLVMGDVLYKVTEAIASGGTIVVDTNVVADANQPGSVHDNAMIEWGQHGRIIWYKVIPGADPTSCTVYVADHQADEDFVCWPFVNNDGNIVPHFYTPIYNGSLDALGRLRSLSGMSTLAGSSASTTNAAMAGHLINFRTAQQERDAARANNPSGANVWDTEVYCDVILVNILLTLMCKSLSTQSKFGEGMHTSGTQTTNNSFVSGVHDDKGLFWGTNSGAGGTKANAVKVFGMENWWGFQWRRFGGLVNVSGQMKYKLTRSRRDGTGVADYVVGTTAAAYAGYRAGASLPSANGTFIRKQSWTPDSAYTPTVADSDSAHHYCDGLWTNNSQVDYASRGGDSLHAARVGAWCLALNHAASYANWYIGAAPSCKPQS